jgi:hypothetical protein
LAAADKQDGRKLAGARVPLVTYKALQLALPFDDHNTMQDLLAAIIDEYLKSLQVRDPGYEKAFEGLRESLARQEGVLSRRTVQ